MTVEMIGKDGAGFGHGFIPAVIACCSCCHCWTCCCCCSAVGLDSACTVLDPEELVGGLALIG